MLKIYYIDAHGINKLSPTISVQNFTPLYQLGTKSLQNKSTKILAICIINSKLNLEWEEK